MQCHEASRFLVHIQSASSHLQRSLHLPSPLPSLPLLPPSPPSPFAYFVLSEFSVRVTLRAEHILHLLQHKKRHHFSFTYLLLLSILSFNFTRLFASCIISFISSAKRHSQISLALRAIHSFMDIATYARVCHVLFSNFLIISLSSSLHLEYIVGLWMFAFMAHLKKKIHNLVECFYQPCQITIHRRRFLLTIYEIIHS